MFDVIIIGAGPVGIGCAILMKEKGAVIRQYCIGGRLIINSEDNNGDVWNGYEKQKHYLMRYITLT